MSDFLGYLHDVSGGASQSDIARAANVGQATVSRWANVRPSAEAMAALARAYHRPISELMIAAGYMDADTTITHGYRISLDAYSHDALLRELARRLDRMSDRPGTINQWKEDPNPDDYDLAAGSVARPNHDPAD